MIWIKSTFICNFWYNYNFFKSNDQIIAYLFLTEWNKNNNRTSDFREINYIYKDFDVNLICLTLYWIKNYVMWKRKAENIFITIILSVHYI